MKSKYIQQYRILVKSNFLLFFLFISFGIISCSEEVDLVLDEGFTRLVVEGQISTDTTRHLIKIRTSSSYFYTEIPPVVSGASVKITDGTNVFNLTEMPVGSGNYYTDSTVFGSIGKNYQLLIDNVDIDKNGKNESYSGQDKILPAWQLDSVVAKYKQRKDGSEGYEVLAFGTEPGGHSDFYMWSYYINGKLGSDSLYKSSSTDDQFFNGIYVPGVPIFNFIEANEGDTLLIETQSISEDYYKFTFALFTEAFFGGGGIMGPPANVPSNVKENAMGYFKTFAVTRNTCIVPKKAK